MNDEKFGIDLDSLLSRLVPDRSDPAFRCGFPFTEEA